MSKQDDSSFPCKTIRHFQAGRSVISKRDDSSLPKLATVGAGTAKVLEAAGLPIAFVPSKATGKVLAAELPAEGSSVPAVVFATIGVGSVGAACWGGARRWLWRRGGTGGGCGRRSAPAVARLVLAESPCRREGLAGREISCSSPHGIRSLIADMVQP